MERKKFLTSMLALALAPSAFNIQYPTGQGANNKGFKINTGEGRIHGHLKLRGINSNIMDLKVSGNDTNGGLAIFEQTSISQGRGTPLHLHLKQDEVFYVIDGEYYFMVGKDKCRLRTGDSIFLPRNIPHAWTQISERGKMTVTFQPAGKMEDFFVTMAGLKNEPSSEEIARIFSEHEMKIVGPTLKIE